MSSAKSKVHDLAPRLIFAVRAKRVKYPNKITGYNATCRPVMLSLLIYLWEALLVELTSVNDL